LEKGILVKKAFLSSSITYTKPNTLLTPTAPQIKANPTPLTPQPKLPNTNPTNKPVPIKPRELGKCWGCQEPWTPEHKFNCKFRRAVIALAIDPENWLAMEQVMEDENHVLLQAEVSNTEQQQPPQLLMISTHAATGASSAATFSLMVHIAGKRGIALVDSGSTDTFLVYSFASQP
jgi:hypothetical protein